MEEMVNTVTRLQERLNEIHRKATRYDKVKALWKKRGFGASVSADYSSFGLIPRDDMIEFFGWDSASTAQIEMIGKEARQASFEWERTQAICTESAENMICFDIPAAPPEIRDHYQQSIEQLIGEEDAALLMSAMSRQLDNGLCRRLVSFSPDLGGNSGIAGFELTTEPISNDTLFVMDAPESQNSIYVTVSGYNENTPANFVGDPIDNPSYFGHAGNGMYAPGSEFYTRWHHLLGDSPF